MLRKLMKYEFGALSRVLLPVYGVVLLLSGIGRIGRSIDLSAKGVFLLLSGLFTFVYVFAIIAAVMLTVFLVIQRFYKTMTCDEGYLTHTLPLSIHTIVGAKLVSAFVWIICAAAVALLGIAILLADKDAWQLFMDMFTPEATAAFYEENGLHFWTMLCWIGALVLISIINQTLMFYAAVSVGQMAGRHKLLGSAAGYMVLYLIGQMLTVGFLLVGCFATGQLVMIFSEQAAVVDVVRVAFTASGISQLIMGISCWFLTACIMRRHLNLE